MKKICEYLLCQKEFDANDREVKRGNGRFCSQSCSSKHFASLKPKPEPNVKCALPLCNQPFYIRPGNLSKSKSGLNFCCRAHKDQAQRIGGVQEIQPSHYGDGRTKYRNIALRNLPHVCNRCGYDKNVAALQVHHKDHNRENGSLDNLEVICSNCHAIEHWSS